MIWLVRKCIKQASWLEQVQVQAKRHVTLPSRSRKRGQVGSAPTRKPNRQVITTEPAELELDLNNLGQKSSFEKSSVLSSASKPSRSILDQVFQDTGHNSVVARTTQTLGLKDRVYPLTASTSIPAVTAAHEIHGVPSFLVQYAYTLKFLQSTPTAYNCKYFTAYYLPPWHFLSLARKSRPAVLSTFSAGAEFNGGDGKPSASGKSRNPMSYAFARKHITQRTRDTLWASMQQNPDSVDGLYMFRSHFYPVDSELAEFQVHVDELVKRAGAMARAGPPAEPRSKGKAKDKGLGWVDDFNKKVRWNVIDTLCKKRLTPPVPRLPAGTGLDWRVGGP